MYPRVDEKDQHDRESIDRQLSQIKDYIENEIASKQSTIDRMQEQLTELNTLILQRDSQLEAVQEKLAECKQTVEGQRQLMNKLLNDISNYQKDIMWYRRTYEQRSLLGLLKDKFFRNTNRDDRNGE